MRDDAVIYAAYTRADLRAHRQSTALATVMTVTAALLYWPGDHSLLAGGLLVLAVVVGSAWGAFRPPRQRKRWDWRVWVPALASAVFGLVIAITLTGPFILALGLTGASAHLATFTINLGRFLGKPAAAPA